MSRLVRLLCLLLAFAAYAANGAQAHLHVSSGDTVDVLMCTPGSGHGSQTTTIQLSDDGPVEVSHTCCGDCTAPLAIQTEPPICLIGPATLGLKDQTFKAPSVHPRSPLWPGAPPQGPPSLRKA